MVLNKRFGINGRESKCKFRKWYIYFMLKRPGILLLSMLTLCLLVKPAYSQGFLKVDGQKIVNQKGENILLRGIGLGGWMVQEGYMLHLQKEGQQYRIRQRITDLIGEEETKAFYSAWLSNHTTQSDIDSLHAWGFNSVRLPLHYNLFTLPIEEEPIKGQNTWLTTGFALTDSLIAWCKMNGMYVILDLHAAPGGQGNDLNISDRDPAKPSLWQNEENKQKTIALWHQLAERYRNEPTVGGYDILNEPNWGFEDTLKDRNGLSEQKNIPLKLLLMDITKSIREVDKNHILIIEGNGWGNNYKGMLGPWDNNMVLSFHKYWNNNDLESIQHILKIREQYNVPVWLGESGENSNVWFTEAIQMLESHNIGWSWWPLKKLGNNNPLQIQSNPDYDALVDYWNGKPGSQAPPAAVVYQSLMTLARNTKCEYNLVHRDVIDAMIRQPFHAQAIAFKRNDIIRGTTVIAAADYDLGINGVAYFDLDTANYRISTGKQSTGNFGGLYRNDGVDIYKDSQNSGSFYVGKIEAGEWMQYTVNVLEPGQYQVVFTVAAGQSGGEISLSDDNQTTGPIVKIDATGGNENWKTADPLQLALTKGIHHLRILAVQGGFNLSRITFSYLGVL
jgi:endoglucanase